MQFFFFVFEFLMYSFVFYFFCILLFIFIMFCIILTMVFDMTTIMTRKIYNWMGKWIVFHKFHNISIELYTHVWKIPCLGMTFDPYLSRGLVTLCPIFANLVPKVAQDFKEKSHERISWYLRRFWSSRKITTGGGGQIAPPPQLR